MAQPEHGSPAPDLYGLLAVPPDASGQDLARAYRRRSRALHPDSRPRDSAAATEFRKLAEAYQILSDPGRRAAYDRELRRRSPASPRPAARWQGQPAASPLAASPLAWPAAPSRAGWPHCRQRPALWAGPVQIQPPGGDQRRSGTQPADGRPSAAGGPGPGADLAGFAGLAWLATWLQRTHRERPW